MVGNGSGKLLIDGKNFNINKTKITLRAHDTIRIKEGSYQGITIQNIQLPKDSTVIITNNGLVQLIGTGLNDGGSGENHQIKLVNLANVKVLGNGNKKYSHGFLLRDNRYRAIQLEGIFSNFELSYFDFKDLGDNVIGYDPENVIYNGSNGTFSENMTFTHLHADNIVELIDFRGWINKDNDQAIRGLIKHIEVAYIQVTNSPNCGTVIHLHNAQDFDIHHVVLENINTARTDHVGIFTINGPGKIHHNLINSGWGNAVRAWPSTLGNSPKELLIYNNIVVNSLKYSAFEVQPTKEALLSGQTTFTNVKIYNNTCGTLSTKGLVVGKILDAFDLFGGRYEVFNNLAFNFPFGGKDIKGPFVSYLGVDEHLVKLSNNLYFDTATQAGIIDQKEFKLANSSPAKNAGKTYTSLTDDYYGISRGNKPSIGAVQ
ncbi:hypothetical protein GCM10023231_03220 [Olivibacter ginsenosidimutans]|uniref:Rhamnogalacturonase A/B/Epimerase-like pectate lyase domain-containing protein n=1 Tax=Olivibacter ginsenosidimutans TaxID=1176537 RepID=A0ABP9ADP5_9SPHI